jgi:hypothetical protein
MLWWFSENLQTMCEDIDQAWDNRLHARGGSLNPSTVEQDTVKCEEKCPSTSTLAHGA